MRVVYFKDTDTMFVEFSAETPAETREIAEDILIELDEVGKLISMTIEHARNNAGLNEFSFVEKQSEG